MWITFIIVGGLVAMTAFAAGFDYLSKKNKGLGAEGEKRLARVEEKISSMEKALLERDEEILKLRNEVGFVNRLIEDKGKGN